jgi:hypothetical protein
VRPELNVNVICTPMVREDAAPPISKDGEMTVTFQPNCWPRTLRNYGEIFLGAV